MARTTVMEGTGEELGHLLGRMPKQRFRLILLPEETASADASAEKAAQTTTGQSYETATAEEWSRAFREWAEGHSANKPPLSDEATSRDGIYEGRS